MFKQAIEQKCCAPVCPVKCLWYDAPSATMVLHWAHVVTGMGRSGVLCERGGVLPRYINTGKHF